jgi:general secretion pathway protein I
MIARRCPPADQRGFTLIETLVAFTIATLLLSVLLAAFAGGVTGSRNAAIRGEAMQLAESTIEAMGAVDAVKDGARFDRAEGRFHVTVAVERYSGGAEAPGSRGIYVTPYDIAVRVSWLEGGRTQFVSLRTLRLGRQQ